MIKQMQFKPIGMNMDNSVSVFDSKLAYRIDNMRIRATNSNTLFSLTTLKGTKQWATGLSGTPIGLAIINHQYILFTKNDYDYIYKITLKNEELKVEEVYKGDLGFNVNNPLETLVYYENEDILKVYWTDGINLPRVINLTNTYTEKDDLNFIKTINNFPIINVEKINISGNPLSPGIIQYIVTGYNKFEAESNILAQSNINYVSYEDRGGKPDELINTGFKINLEQLSGFDYIKVYRVHKTSLEEIGKVDLIADLKMENSMSIIDSGVSISSIDPSELLYIGGVPIIAQTMTQKDGTLFLGNIELINKSLGGIEYDSTTNLFDYFYDRSKSDSTITDKLFNVTSGTKEIVYKDNNLFYGYTPSTSLGESLKYFKKGETYRLGFIGIDEYGIKSDVIWVGDYVQENKVVKSTDSATVGNFILSIEESIITKIKLLGFKFIMPVIVYPTLADRTIKALGIVSPTVYNVEDRYNGTCDVQSSWFFRPSDEDYLGCSISYAHGHSTDISIYNDIKSNIDLKETIFLTEVLSALGPHMQTPSAYYTKDDIENNNSITGYPISSELFVQLFGNRYFIDSNTVTFHSPEIESEEVLNPLGLKFKITGYISRDYKQYRHYLDYVTLDGGNANKNIKRNIPVFNDVYDSPIIPSFLDYGSGVFPMTTDLGNPLKDALRYFAIHPWHRSGSINDDLIDTDTKKRTSVLKNKVMSRIEIYPDYTYLEETEIENINKSYSEEYTFKLTIDIFNSNENSIIKLDGDGGYKKDFIYKGNVDTVNTPILNNIEKIITDEDITTTSYSRIRGLLNLTSIPSYPALFNTPKISILGQENITVDYLLLFNILNSEGYLIYATYENFPNNNSVEGYSSYAPLVSGDNAYYYYMVGKDPTSIKYKSLPHAVINLGRYTEDRTDYSVFIEQCLPRFFMVGSENVINAPYTPFYCVDEKNPFKAIYLSVQNSYNYDNVNNKYEKTIIWVGELYADNILNRFGGEDKSVLLQHNWLQCGEIVSTDALENIELEDGTIQRELSVTYSIGDTYFLRYDCLKTYPYAEGDTNSIVNIVSVPIETRVNLDLRTDKNRGLEDNTSIRPTNFNLFNSVYNQSNNFFKYHVLDLALFNTKKFKNTITWTKTKLAGDNTDSWTNITMANTLDLDGDKGEIISLNRFNNNVLAFQTKAISQILYNENMLISTTLGVPIEIGNSGKVLGKRYISEQLGCSNKWSICESPLGLYFIDDYTKGIYLFNGQIANLSDLLGFSSWIRQYYNIDRDIWNPNSFNNFISYYDTLNREVLFINSDDCLVYSEPLSQFSAFYNYNNIPYFSYIDNQFISVYNGNIYKNEEGNPSEFYGNYKPFGVTVVANADAPYDKIFNTLEFRTSTVKDLANPINDLFEYTFDSLKTWNDYQKGELDLSFVKDRVSNLKRKFRIWRANIPRDGRNRMRNPWLFISLYNENLYYTEDNDGNKNYDYPLELHDMIVHYFI